MASDGDTLRRTGSQMEASVGRRGSWLSSESKSAAPDEDVLRRILAEPSAYASRPATAGNAARAAGGQRMADSGVTRGGCTVGVH